MNYNILDEHIESQRRPQRRPNRKGMVRGPFRKMKKN